jgi:hypothetical protein
MSAKTATTTVEERTRTEPLNYGPDKGNAILAAWQGLHWLFGAEADSFNVTPEGVYVNGLTMWSDYTPTQIVEDISKKERRLDLIFTYPIVNGENPAPFATSQEVTLYMVQFFRGSQEDGSSKSPQYLRKAAADFKATVGLKAKRGPKRKIFRLDNLDAIDPTMLKDVDPSDLDHLMAAIREAKAAAKAEAVPTA